MNAVPDHEVFEGATLTPKQKEARKMMSGNKLHNLLLGGSRSGKTTVACRQICVRAIKKESSHLILRDKFNHLKTSIILDTMPKVLKLWFPHFEVKLNKVDWYHEFLHNGSRIFYGGLDDAERAEKILGQEHSTIYLNECSQISFGPRNKAVTRCAQDSGLKLKMFYDCNPPSKAHWLYKVFVLGVDPYTGEKIKDFDQYCSMRINPQDNEDNLPPQYLDILKNMTERERKRFFDGLWSENVKNALWPEGSIKRMERPSGDDITTKEWLLLRSRLKKVYVCVDPSGCDKDEEVNNDEIGILVVGVFDDGTGVVLQDETGYYTPASWGLTCISLYEKWSANGILCETNYGGPLAVENIRGSVGGKHVPIEKINVRTSKHIRAEPVAGLYEKKRVVHLGNFVDLETEMGLFSTGGYTGVKSPNHVDCLTIGFKKLIIDEESSSEVW
jgi:phage terminase large subunit-like protein